jgi:PKD repeat protein
VVAVYNPPVADAGIGQNIYLGQTALLDGSASSDPDGDPIVSYTWTFDAAPVGSAFADPYASLSDVTPSFTPDLIGDYLLSLVVNDGALNSAAATVLVTATQNLAPVATASSDVYTGVAPLTVNFDASASYDPEGGALTYSWNFADPTTGVNNVSNLPNPSHAFNTAGTYTVLVDVIDDFGNVTQASVDIIATDPVVTYPPGGDTGTGSNELELNVHEAKVDYGKNGKVKGKVSVKAGFINIGSPAADDRIAVSLDGVVLLDVPFSEFQAEDKPGEYEYKGKHLKAEINISKPTIKVKRHKMVLSGIDNSDGVDIKVSIGSLSGFENIEMKAKQDDHEGKRKLSYKNKQHDDD